MFFSTPKQQTFNSAARRMERTVSLSKSALNFCPHWIANKNNGFCAVLKTFLHAYR